VEVQKKADLMLTAFGSKNDLFDIAHQAFVKEIGAVRSFSTRLQDGCAPAASRAMC
jgi:hypothetical protein